MKLSKNVKVVLGELEDSVLIKPSEASGAEQVSQDAVWFLQKQTQAKNLQDDPRPCERTEVEEEAKLVNQLQV